MSGWMDCSNQPAAAELNFKKDDEHHRNGNGEHSEDLFRALLERTASIEELLKKRGFFEAEERPEFGEASLAGSGKHRKR